MKDDVAKIFWSAFIWRGANRNGCQFSSHANVLAEESGDDHGDHVGNPPRPRVRDTSVADTEDKMYKVEGHSEIQTLECVWEVGRERGKREGEKEREFSTMYILLCKIAAHVIKILPI